MKVFVVLSFHGHFRVYNVFALLCLLGPEWNNRERRVERISERSARTGKEGKFCFK